MRNIPDNRLALFGALGLVVLTLIAYWQVQVLEFVSYDDGIYVFQNDHVRRGLSLDGFFWAFRSTEASNWHPLTWLSLMLDASLFGLSPGGYHWTNLVLHIANTLLLLGVLRRMTHDTGKSLFVAAAFALHPLHVESVAWVAERKDVLSALFWMLTLAAYVAYAERPSIHLYALVIVSFLFGLMAKPMVVTLPFVLILLDYWPLGRWHAAAVNRSDCPVCDRSLRRNRAVPFVWLLLDKVPLFVLAGISSVITYVIQQRDNAVAAADQLSLVARIANATVAYVAYLEKTFWPSNLAVFYPHPGSWPVTAVALSVALLLFVTVCVLYFTRNYQFLFVGWFWYLGTLVPVIGLVQVGSQAMADRYTYIPLVGVLVMIAWGVPDFLRQWLDRKGVLLTAAVAIMLVLTVLTAGQVGHWQNNFSLFCHAAAVTKGNYIAENNIAHALLDRGKLDDAFHHFSAAARIKQNFEPAYDGMGLVYFHKGRYAEAEKMFQTALLVMPDYVDAHFHLAGLCAKQGRYGEAETHYRRALRIQPETAILHNSLGVVLTQQKKYDEAIREYRDAVRLQPNHIPASYNLAMVLRNRDRSEEAARVLSDLLRREPLCEEARHLLRSIRKAPVQTEEDRRHLEKTTGIDRAVAGQISKTADEQP